ncbi:hypothetical protein ABT112_32190 [Streptomyces sp. NPDC002055]|uniref:hypothetical protein n=1 Tax=Streptomyces sp. NPDC002055 TaxID=3154534 RepID=UPI003330AE77
MSPKVPRHIQERFDGGPTSAAWCTIGSIPAPPPEVHEGAGNGPLGPGSPRPLEVLRQVLAAPLRPLRVVFDALQRFDTRFLNENGAGSVRHARARRDAAVAEHGLDRVFDGDWCGSAGQLLLRWYEQSAHPGRLVALGAGRIVLAGPVQRVAAREPHQLQILTEFTPDEAVLEDPLLGAHRHDRLRLRFSDGSWLVLVTDGSPSDIHWHLWGKERPPADATGRRRRPG